MDRIDGRGCQLPRGQFGTVAHCVTGMALMILQEFPHYEAPFAMDITIIKLKVLIGDIFSSSENVERIQ